MGTLIRNIRLIIAGSLLLMAVLAIATMLLESSSEFVPNRKALAFPAEVAAMAQLLDGTAPQTRPVLLRALNTPNIAVHVAAAAPPPLGGGPVMPGLQEAIQLALARLDASRIDAPVQATSGAAQLQIANGNVWAMRPVQVAVALKSGGYLVIDARRPLIQRLNGIGIALAILLMVLIVGGFTLYLLSRQLRPLMRLSEAVERFGARLEATDLPDDGAQEVRDLTNAFRLLQTRIRDLIAGRTRMMAAIGHDLGTYLTRLRLRIDFIDNAEERTRAERDIAEMQSLISGTLALARLDHDSEAIQCADIAALLQRRGASFSSAGGTVRCAASEPVYAEVRPAAMARAFDNLISNALKYGGEADLSVHAEQGACVVRIDDRGPGIPLEDRAAVLEPFYRRDPARNLDEAGFGLGLAIVAEIIARHGATLSLDDRPGGGLTITIRLTLAAPGKAD